MFSDNTTIFEIKGPWGIPIQFGSTLIMLAFLFVGLGVSIEALPYQIAFFVMIVVSIFLHELGHAWGCIVQGIPVKRIMIHGGGGFCEPARSASVYQDEFIVAMGPIVNLALWAIGTLILPFVGNSNPDLVWGLATFAWMNLFLAIFNMIPTMPLDGGRLFHFSLLRFMAPTPARRVAGGVGVVLAIIWIPLMFWVYFNIGFILFFFPPLRLHWQMLRA